MQVFWRVAVSFKLFRIWPPGQLLGLTRGSMFEVVYIPYINSCARTSWELQCSICAITNNSSCYKWCSINFFIYRIYCTILSKSYIKNFRKYILSIVAEISDVPYRPLCLYFQTQWLFLSCKNDYQLGTHAVYSAMLDLKMTFLFVLIN